MAHVHAALPSEAQRLSNSSSSMCLVSSINEPLPNPLPVLTLKRELVFGGPISRGMYKVIEGFARVLPCCIIVGGVIGLFGCIWLQYDWCVVMSIAIYTLLQCKCAWEIVIFGARGVFQCYVCDLRDWYSLYQQSMARDGEGNIKKRLSVGPQERAPLNLCDVENGDDVGKMDMGWTDVFHVVMVPNYKTPIKVLEEAIMKVQSFSLAKTNMGICLAFEEREAGAEDKARMLKDKFKGAFHFITATYHPPNLPNHVPGKSSNECWAFSELAKELKNTWGYDAHDPRVVITVMDDDSEWHPNYFEALNYHFLQREESLRYLTIWQPPIVHFKNYSSQPAMIRIVSIATSMHELCCLGNNLDCHVPFSSYSLSLVLASAVGGWDPDFISEDWHMMAKCVLKTHGRAHVEPIFLPLINYAPEEETWWGSMSVRWEQGKRHALGVSELVYVVSNTFVGMCESGSLSRALLYLWRVFPVISKFLEVHFVVGTMPICLVVGNIIMNRFPQTDLLLSVMAACESATDPVQAACSHLNSDPAQIAWFHSWAYSVQQKAVRLAFVAVYGLALVSTAYWTIVKNRSDGRNMTLTFTNPLLHHFRLIAEFALCGCIGTFLFGTVPVWIACFRILLTLRFYHTVAGMIGREEDGGTLSDSNNL